MKVGALRRKGGGARIIGTLERIPGVALATDFIVHEDGRIEAVYESQTDIWWDGQETEVDENDQIILVDENLDTCGIHDVEHFEE